MNDEPDVITMLHQLLDTMYCQEPAGNVALLQMRFAPGLGTERYAEVEVASPTGKGAAARYEDVAKAIRVLWRMHVREMGVSDWEAHEAAEAAAVTPYEVEDPEGEKLIEEVRAKYTRDHLRSWAWLILATKAEDMPLMVAEDPSVLHVVAAYLREVEGRPRRKVEEP